ncbi:MAG: epimerase [Devosia sp.]|nr:epimerase [Devosia sp.]
MANIGRIEKRANKAPITGQVFATSAVEVTVDITKARNELGYEPVMSREAGLAELTALRPD